MEQPRLHASSPATTPTCCSTRPPTRSGATSSPRRSAASCATPTPPSVLIPKDHRYGEHRPPFVTGYFEAFNRPNVSLVDLSARPRCVRVTADRHRDRRRLAGIRRHRVGDRLRLRHRRAAAHGHPTVAAGSRLNDHWADGPEDVPRRSDLGLSEPLLSRRPARRRRQQPALQRRPGRFHHRHADLRPRPRLRHDRGRPGRRGRVDRDDRPRRAAQAVLRRPAATTSARTSPASRASTCSTPAGRPKLLQMMAEVNAAIDYKVVQTVAIGVVAASRRFRAAAAAARSAGTGCGRARAATPRARAGTTSPPAAPRA